MEPHVSPLVDGISEAMKRIRPPRRVRRKGKRVDQRTGTAGAIRDRAYRTTPT